MCTTISKGLRCPQMAHAAHDEQHSPQLLPGFDFCLR